MGRMYSFESQASWSSPARLLLSLLVVLAVARHTAQAQESCTNRNYKVYCAIYICQCASRVLDATMPGAAGVYCLPLVGPSTFPLPLRAVGAVHDLACE
jgi:hypothetical protein